MPDIERLAAFYGQIFGPSVQTFAYTLIVSHPATRPEHWLFIEDMSSGQIVSALSLIPWQWRYEEVTLKSGEMACVATAEPYRNRGLIRALARRHKELLREERCDLSHIQGIPYFYRQFGYEYAMPLEPGWHLELHHVPEITGTPYSFRPATLDDIPVLMRLYDEAAAPLDINTMRDGSTMRYLIEDCIGTDTEGQFWLVLDSAAQPNTQPAGYFRIMEHGFGHGLIVSETSRLNYAMIPAVLSQLKTLAVERNKPSIRFNLPIANDLLRAARGCGAYDTGTYAWQILLVDIPNLLRKLAPILERRIAASPFTGLSRKVGINLYREAFELHFECGKLLAVNAIGYRDSGEIRIPPTLFAPLVLGYRSREELAACYPDVSIWGQAQQLVDVLFPKLSSFIFTMY